MLLPKSLPNVRTTALLSRFYHIFDHVLHTSLIILVLKYPLLFVLITGPVCNAITESYTKSTLNFCSELPELPQNLETALTLSDTSPFQV